MFTCSPIGARRVKTDLQTSELKNVFIEQRTSSNYMLNTSVVNSKKTSPVIGSVRKLNSVTNVATNTSPQKLRWLLVRFLQRTNFV